jgi:hypothetical protein
MLRASYPYYLANEPVPANTDLAVTNKYTLEVATRVALADAGVRGHPFRHRRHDRTPLAAAQGRWQAVLTTSVCHLGHDQYGVRFSDSSKFSAT